MQETSPFKKNISVNVHYDLSLANAGINEFKLKQGFKQVFNNTVFGYLSDYKLNQARELLLRGNTAIKEVADSLGYSSVQHFSHAFRKKFGVPPGRVRG